MQVLDHWGYIPTFLDRNDPRPVKDQFNERYVFGGWQPFKGFKFDPLHFTLKYPGDPLMLPIDSMKFRDETVILFQSAWVVILQKDNTWEVARMD